MTNRSSWGIEVWKATHRPSGETPQERMPRDPWVTGASRPTASFAGSREARSRFVRLSLVA